MGKVDEENQMKSESAEDDLIHVTIHSVTPIIPEQNYTSILVADDDAFYLSLIEMILFPLNYKIIHAKNGQEAVNLYRANNEIKLILMDIQMPVMDGFTATKEIRKLNPEIPILAFSTCGIERIKTMAIFSGCNEFIPKPVEPEVLSMKIKQYLKQTAKNIPHS
jgi:CheY-like chemotaxis protein